MAWQNPERPHFLFCTIWLAQPAQMLPISAWKSSSSFWTVAYFLAISSYLDSHVSRSVSRAWTFRSKCPALTSVWRSLWRYQS